MKTLFKQVLIMTLSITGCAKDFKLNDHIASGPCKPTWESLRQNYQCPEWFRDAKFGIWAHWSAQCVPEEGDWYARNIYLQGSGQYKYHVEHYGHPSKFGFMEFDNLWKAEKWEPERMMALYKAAGAKYFVALANHHDNFDCYDSKHHAWNSVRIGPKKDIVGIWAKVARENGLRFGVSNHSAHAWHWFQPAYGYDPEGPLAGVRYDAATLTKADGKGKWWEGLDPQDLYTGSVMPLPEGITTIKEANEWHDKHDRVWNENPPADNPKFVQNWFLRCQDLTDKYKPDLVYFDNDELPLGNAGLAITADYYNKSIARDRKINVVVNGKHMKPENRTALVEDYERGSSDEIQPLPWQTDTCIGEWHYHKGINYKSVSQVVRSLVNIVSKNGNLLLSVPVRGDGSLDEKEIAFLQGMAKWMEIHSEGIFGTRPWTIAGEGPDKGTGGKAFSEGKVAFGAEDIRFTTKDGVLYVFVLGGPTHDIAVKSLGLKSPHAKPIESIELLGSTDPMKWRQSDDALVITKPTKSPSEDAIAFRVRFKQ
jgi:alpha-L-fucosidase